MANLIGCWKVLILTKLSGKLAFFSWTEKWQSCFQWVQVLVHNLSNGNEFDVQDNEGARKTHSPRLVLKQREKTTWKWHIEAVMVWSGNTTYTLPPHPHCCVYFTAATTCFLSLSSSLSLCCCNSSSFSCSSVLSSSEDDISFPEIILSSCLFDNDSNCSEHSFFTSLKLSFY